MRIFLMALAVTACATAGSAQTPAKPAKPAPAAPAAHVLLTPGDLKWGPAPPVLPAGAQLAVLDGDPGKPGFFSVRLKFPDGYKIPAHWHPTDENIVVLQGTFRAGMGNALSESGLHEFPVGLVHPDAQGHAPFRGRQGRDHRADLRTGSVRHHLRESG